MGNLARIGIIDGRKVPLDGIPGAPVRQELSAFARKCLGRFGYARIAERIIEGAPLSIRDIESLLIRAPLPVLMKLVELRVHDRSCVAPSPLVVLPVNEWLNEHSPERVVELSADRLRSLPYDSLRVVLEGFDARHMDDTWLTVLANIARSRPGVTFVGPAVDDVVSWMLSLPNRGEAHQSANANFETVLRRLRESGLNRLRPSSVVDVLKSVGSAGFPVSIITNLGEFDSVGDLARELFRIHEHSVDYPVEVWIPGYEPRSGSARALPIRGARDYQLLRLLAVGALALNAVPYRRASTRYFSIEAVRIARLCGANDLGFGAVDAHSARVMQLEEYGALTRVAGSMGSRPSQEVSALHPEA